MEGGLRLKKILLTITAMGMLAGCSNGDKTVDTPNPKMELLVKENTLLHERLDARPPLSAQELRETMTLSLKALDAMVNKNYEYLESIAAPGVIIKKDSNSFQFEGGFIQNFLQSIDYSKLEYRFHDMKDDVVTVGFAQPPGEYYFEFIYKDDKVLLQSFLTN